jgi:hypothetical protein
MVSPHPHGQSSAADQGLSEPIRYRYRLSSVSGTSSTEVVLTRFLYFHRSRRRCMASHAI